MHTECFMNVAPYTGTGTGSEPTQDHLSVRKNHSLELSFVVLIVFVVITTAGMLAQGGSINSESFHHVIFLCPCIQQCALPYIIYLWATEFRELFTYGAHVDRLLWQWGTWAPRLVSIENIER